MDVLKSMLEEIGFDTVITSVTGWGNAPVPEGAVPMFGSYPEAPWDGHLNVLENGDAYGFYVHESIRDFHSRYGDNTEMNYPIFTCELGGGNQCTYTRRPLIQPWEVAAQTVMHPGTGANGIGYYMYHGGLNPVVEKKRESASFISGEQREVSPVGIISISLTSNRQIYPAAEI